MNYKIRRLLGKNVFWKDYILKGGMQNPITKIYKIEYEGEIFEIVYNKEEDFKEIYLKGLKNKCFFKTSEINTNKKVLTEDLGKIFEMAICLLYKTEYDGNYKYSLEEANSIKERICQLKYVFPYNIKHIAKNGNQYDFVSIDEKNIGEKR